MSPSTIIQIPTKSNNEGHTFVVSRDHHSVGSNPWSLTSDVQWKIVVVVIDAKAMAVIVAIVAIVGVVDVHRSLQIEEEAMARKRHRKNYPHPCCLLLHLLDENGKIEEIQKVKSKSKSSKGSKKTKKGSKKQQDLFLALSGNASAKSLTGDLLDTYNKGKKNNDSTVIFFFKLFELTVSNPFCWFTNSVRFVFDFWS